MGKDCHRFSDRENFAKPHLAKNGLAPHQLGKIPGYRETVKSTTSKKMVMPVK
jgi:hypothetical protein